MLAVVPSLVFQTLTALLRAADARLVSGAAHNAALEVTRDRVLQLDVARALRRARSGPDHARASRVDLGLTAMASGGRS
jgi:hypothetical protein